MPIHLISTGIIYRLIHDIEKLNHFTYSCSNHFLNFFFTLFYLFHCKFKRKGKEPPL